MTDLQEEDYIAAMTRLTPHMQRCLEPQDLDQPDVQPLCWELSEMDEFSNIHGTAVFSDGREFPLMFRMVWLEGRWQINGFEFGAWPEKRLDYLDLRCDEQLR